MSATLPRWILEDDMSNRLNAGDTFPEVTLMLVGGKSIRFPSELDGRYRIVLFYRGHW